MNPKVRAIVDGATDIVSAVAPVAIELKALGPTVGAWAPLTTTYFAATEVGTAIYNAYDKQILDAIEAGVRMGSPAPNYSDVTKVPRGIQNVAPGKGQSQGRTRQGPPRTKKAGKGS